MRYFATLLLFILWAAVVYSLAGCSSLTMPDRENFDSEQCYMAALCGWENSNNKDTDSDRDCSGYDSECRAFGKYIFCGCEDVVVDEKGETVLNEDGSVKVKTNRWKGQDPDDCWKTLNQK